MPNELLIDSGFLYALFDQDDRYHRVVKTVQEIETSTALVPDIVLVEAAFLARRTGNVPAVASFLHALEQFNFQLQALSGQDLSRAREILETYTDAQLDFVDCCLMALAERLKIRRVCTIDPRDFYIFRPAHCDRLEILPMQLPLDYTRR
jgi:predicted nucleic acid-binding protein